MSLVVPYEGERRLLGYIVNQSSPTDLILHLYTNSVDLSGQAFTTSSFTEVNASGYASVNLNAASWNISTVNGVTAAVYNVAVSFTFNVGQGVYGYYVTTTSGQIVWAEQFPGAPFNLPISGGEISVRPQIQLN